MCVHCISAIYYYYYYYCILLDEIELELRLSRFENLMDTRPVLLSSVLLRQNPHNVHEWHKRVGLFEGRPADIIKTYTEAVQTVDIQQAIGKPHTLWTAFAQFYENNNQLPEVRMTLSFSLSSLSFSISSFPINMFICNFYYLCFSCFLLLFLSPLFSLPSFFILFHSLPFSSFIHSPFPLPLPLITGLCYI